MVTTGEAARRLGVDRITLARWAKAGLVRPHSKTLGGHLRWNLDDLREQIKRQQQADPGS